MAFPAAPGHNNLPNGVWSPVIYSKKAQLAFRKESVVQAITSSEYFGEIKDFGDSVKIIKEPAISVAAYLRGQQIQTQDLIDEDFTLIIDKANYYAFKVDDIEKSMAHVNWLEMATSQAGYKLTDNFDQDILGYMSGYKQTAMHLNASTARLVTDMPGTRAISTAGVDELLTVNKMKKGDFGRITTASAGDHSIPLAPRLPGITTYPTDVVSPLDVFNQAALLLDLQNAPQAGRWAVVDPTFLSLLRDEDSRLFQAEWGKTGGLRNGQVTETPIQGFKLYVSRNLPIIGTGPGTVGVANQNTNFGIIIFGMNQAVATAENMNQTETLRSADFFGNVVRGMHLYGRKILRPECIVTAKWNKAA